MSKASYEYGARKPEPGKGEDASDEFPQDAASNRPPESERGLSEPTGLPGTADQRPRWEGPPENRPRGYLPAEDDPDVDRDAAHENLQDPDRSDLGDFAKQRTSHMDHSAHIRLTPDELTSENLEGAAVYGADEEKVGSISHVHGSGESSRVVIDVGGFLGIGAKPVAVAASALDIMRDEGGEVHAVTSWTKEQLKDMPEHRD